MPSHRQPTRIQRTRKAVLATLGVLAQVLTVALAVGGVLPEVALPYAAVVIGLAQVYGVYRVRNAQAQAPRPVGSVPLGQAPGPVAATPAPQSGGGAPVAAEPAFSPPAFSPPAPSRDPGPLPVPES